MSELGAALAEEELATRLEGAGLAGVRGWDATTTIRSPLAPDGAEAPDQGNHAQSTGARALPRISVDLGEPRAEPTTPSERDLAVLGVLGEGGMGRVYLARQHSLDREVALKTLLPTGDERQARALLEEGAISGHLEHPGVIPVHALGVDDGGRPVLVMKRVEGVTWSQLLNDPQHAVWETRDRGADRLEDQLSILMQLCNAVHYAHSRQVVHRDIKPDNVLIGRFGDVYLADWGIALRLDQEQTRSFAGTPAYMAPEMALGELIDARTDVYLLGATLHELLTGHPRHSARFRPAPTAVPPGERPLGGALAAMRSAARSEPIRYDTSVPAALATIANKATARLPEERYADAAEFRRALADYLRHKSARALTDATGPKLTQLKALLGDESAWRREEVQAELDRALAEARFGLMQAQREWPESPEARTQLAQLDTLEAARRARHLELARLAHDHDPDRSSRGRVVAQLGLAVVGITLSVSAFTQGFNHQPSAEALVREGLMPVAVVTLAGLVFRRQLTETAVNRRAALCLLASVCAIAAGRLLGARSGMAPHHMVVYDSIIAATTSLLTSTSAMPWLIWSSIIMATTAVGAGLFPELSYFIFSLGTASSLMTFAYFARIPLKPRRASDTRPD